MTRSELDPAVVDDLRRNGLYDPQAPDADQRLTLLRFNLEQGVTVDELVAAQRLGRLAYVGGDPHIRPPGGRLSLAELAGRTGTDEVEVLRIWRAVGLAEPTDENPFTEADVGVIAVFTAATGVFGRPVALQLARTMGAAMARVAEAGATAVTTVIGSQLGHADPIELAQANVAIAQQLPEITAALDVLYRHHILSTNCRLMVDPTTRESQTKRIAVGFADLVGFTAWTASSEPHAVAALVEDFEARTRDAVTEHDGRVVKMIGDEVMFVAADGATACDVASALLAETQKLEALPNIRVGLSYGDVLTGYGDYYGPIVNLAARLVSAAEPGQVLLDAETRRQAHDAGWSSRSTGTRSLKGFPQPVDTYELARTPK